MTREWDAATYDRVADPMTRWGAGVLSRLPLRGDETVLDAGCGSGRVTELLAERVPAGRVIALDGSAAMVASARERLGRFGERVSYVVADLGQPLPLEAAVDAVLSTATFHWVPDHDALFRNLAVVVRPGGRLAAQCGGAGNIANIDAVMRAIDPGWLGSVHFETAEATTDRLAAAGFVDVRCWLSAEPTDLPPDAPFEAFLSAVVLGEYLQRVPATEREAFVADVARRIGQPHIEYVRLNIDATRAS
jgi:trans-aconitate 2-methyltransferase